MLAKAGALPGADEEHAWAFEMKWDGIRAIVLVDDGRIEIRTRNDRDVSAAYPELTKSVPSTDVRRLLLDGEIVALDAAGRPSFERLQRRMHVSKPDRAQVLSGQFPVHFFAFDLLRLDGQDLTALPWSERRALLESLTLPGPRWLVPPVFEGDGPAAVAASRAQVLEGVMAKRRDSTYVPGRRSDAWLKIKHVHAQEVVIGGWRPGEGRRAGGIGALLMGIPGPGGLHYVGRVGTGFSDQALDVLAEQLGPDVISEPPFAGQLSPMDARGAVWVRPRLVGEVTFAELTSQGRLRHPSWRGLRPDKAPADVNDAELFR